MGIHQTSFLGTNDGEAIIPVSQIGFPASCELKELTAFDSGWLSMITRDSGISKRLMVGPGLLERS